MSPEGTALEASGKAELAKGRLLTSGILLKEATTGKLELKLNTLNETGTLLGDRDNPKLARGIALEIKGKVVLKPLTIKGKALKTEILASDGAARLLKAKSDAGTKLDRAKLAGKDANETNEMALILSARAELARGAPLLKEASGIRTEGKLLNDKGTKLLLSLIHI